MKSKIWTFINWGVLAVVTLVAIWMVWGFPQGEDQNSSDFFMPSVECVDVVSLEGFEYEACYDASSEMIFVKTNRKKEVYEINSLDISFVDLSSHSYSLDDVPKAGEKRAYKILANKKPKNINIRLNVVKNFSGSACGGKSIFVDYCPAGTAGNDIGVSISPIEGVEITDFIEITDFSGFDSDIIVMDLADREKIWESSCRSDWECGEWESCEKGVQRRECRDLNGCMISTDSPAGTQRCDGSCVENWECEWSGCENGFSIPRCNDLNDCGTSYGVPKKLSCDGKGECSPDIVCSDWTECNVDYNFVDLIGPNQVTLIEGSRSRVCVDKEGCIASNKEEESCSVAVDVYANRFERCGQNYVGVYNVLDDSTLAVLEKGMGDESYLNIYFEGEDKVYCDYCFDGEMNGDEEGVDCGGSCEKCQDEVLEDRRWWEFLF